MSNRETSGRETPGAADEAQFARLIKETAALAEDADEAQFLGRFYADVAARDLVDRGAEALYRGMRSMLEAAALRTPGAPRILVRDDGSTGARRASTVIEIVNDDMPFLVDSVTGALNRRGLTVDLVIHPVLRVRRDADGRLLSIPDSDPDPDPDDPEAISESWMRIEIDRHAVNDAAREIEAALHAVLADVRAAVEDWRPMVARARAAIDRLDELAPPLPEEEVAEGRAFLEWLSADHFIFLGHRVYEVVGDGDAARMGVVRDSGLGILRDPDFHVFEGVRDMGELPPDVRAFLERPELLVVNKANLRSTVHRPAHLDAIGVKLFDDEGRVTGEMLFVGLFTSAVYTLPPTRIPMLRLKLRRAMDRATYAPDSHNGKALRHILMTYPRDELFQIEDDDLFRIGTGILHLQERQRIALFARYDSFKRFVSCLVYVPRERYTTDMRGRFAGILEQDFGGPVTAYYTQISDDAVLSRIHFILKTDPAAPRHEDVAATERRLVEAGRSWGDLLRAALIEEHGEATGLALCRRYEAAFPVGYRAATEIGDAVADVAAIERAFDDGPDAGLQLDFRRDAGEAGAYRFRVYNPGASVPLSAALPVLENMGLRIDDEVPYRVDVEGHGSIWIHDFGVTFAGEAPEDPLAHRDRFHEAFLRAWRGETENDGFNALVLGAGLTWRETAVLRACGKYLRQAGLPFTDTYLHETFAATPGLARLVIDLFLDRFPEDPSAPPHGQPDGRPGGRADEIRAEIDTALDAVASLDQDRIVRRFVNLVEAMLRTSYRLTDADGAPLPYLSFKLDSQAIDDLPLPRPMVEIWVYSPRVEGVHLRFGKVARGGIRWSDRREDFRTEILGLVKAQVVKNAVIVPVGSKGGFFVKRPPAGGDRSAIRDEGVECYRIFIRGLLDLTDNIVEGEVVPPEGVTRYDDDDPYLVVAADKGTASFSDIANGVAEEYGFWLGDAFASGGSAGYDHKAMGITARGGWEAVKRHFRELGRDIQREAFTVAGIGDMAGDVFGNGMLLSPCIRLVAAFNHQHIFVDPEADPETGFAERKRLFELSGSSWADYDRSLIGEGGGVFERTAKSIRLSQEMKSLFGLARDRVTPSELIRAILAAEVDLLWFGGIGTYVKASDESHADVGDRVNDAVRVDGRALRAKVIGEGANLGLTQRGRIEYALHDGRINTDAIDNSGGVDCSDHEVNIKILLGAAMERGDLDRGKRDNLLASMADEVAELVLRDNYLQTAALSVSEEVGVRGLDRLWRFIRDLERAGIINRQVEGLPDDEELERRLTEQRGLVRPELAVLLAYAKNTMFDRLVASDMPDDPCLVDDLVRYFPEPLRERYRGDIEGHRLRREIVATMVTNSAINRAGITLLHDLEAETGMPAADAARAYVVVRDAFRLRALWDALEALDTDAGAAAAQRRALLDTGRLIKRAAEWFLRHADRPLDIGATVGTYAKGLDTFCGALEDILPPRPAAAIEARTGEYREAGLPDGLARTLAMQSLMLSGCNVVRLAEETGAPIEKVGRLFFAVGERFSLPWLREVAYASAADLYWDKMAAYAAMDDFYEHQVAMTRGILVPEGASDAQPPEDAGAAIEEWTGARAPLAVMVDRMIDDVRSAGSVDLAMLAVVNRQMRLLLAG